MYCLQFFPTEGFLFSYYPIFTSILIGNLAPAVGSLFALFSIKINVKKDSLDLTTLDIFISDQLHSLERKDINVEWQDEDIINIIFSDKASYKVILEENQKTAKIVK